MREMRASLVVVLIAGLTACGGKGTEPARPAEPAPVSNLVIHAPAEPPPEVPPPPSETPTPLATTTTGVPECDAYLAAFDELTVRCVDQLGPALDAMKQARDAQAQAFADWSRLDDESAQAVRQAAAPGCQAGLDALQQTAAAMGCPLY